MNGSRVVVQVGETTNTCFVMMPFQDLFKSQYEKVIRPAIEAAGLKCKRGDEIYSRQNIVDDIWSSIRESRVVLAELSGRNPNVMYEIGLAHAIGKAIVFVTRNEDDVPFDLRNLRYIYYDINDPNWGDNLRAAVTELLQKILSSSSTTAHLEGINVEAKFPEAPMYPVQRPIAKAGPVPNLGGSWLTHWNSIRRQRLHRAALVIPANQGNDFIASLIVTYEREGQQTIVQETLTGGIHDTKISLVGVNYTYVQQGSSSTYSLDNFELTPGDVENTLVGKAILQHGTVDVTFTRQRSPAVSDPLHRP